MPREGPYPFLSYARFRFFLRVTSSMVLPPYKGAVFRGAFGNAFRRLVCLAPLSECTGCTLRENCLYITLFEPSPPAGYADAGKFRQAPRPYVINPPLTTREVFHRGEYLHFEMVLLGPALKALHFFIQIFIQMGRRGLGPERGRFDLIRVDLLRDNGDMPIYDGRRRTLASFEPVRGPKADPGDHEAASVTLEFLTPLRLKEKGDLVTRLTFPLFFETLARRLSLLVAFYGNGAKAPDFSSLTAQAEEIAVSLNNLRWYDWERYSRRQNATMKLGGLTGKITLTGVLLPFIPYLRLAASVNVGHNTTFGLGRYGLVYS